VFFCPPDPEDGLSSGKTGRTGCSAESTSRDGTAFPQRLFVLIGDYPSNICGVTFAAVNP